MLNVRGLAAGLVGGRPFLRRLYRRLAEANPLEGQRNPRLELLYVIDLPLTVPLEGPIPAERVAAADRALARAQEITDEYPGVEADIDFVLARDVG